MSLFSCTVENLADWAKIYNRTEPFEPRARHILALHSLPQTDLEETTPGSHAVLHAGDVIVKIFAPDTVGWDCEGDFQTEIAAMKRAHWLGVPVPALLAYGRIMDKYCFRYIVMEYIRGTEFAAAVLSDNEKTAVGRKLRSICEILHTAYTDGTWKDCFTEARRNEKWHIFPESFRTERLRFLESHRFSASVYVHGDIHGENVILTPNGQLVLLDFADSVRAPSVYEYAALIPGLFRYEKPYLDGFFGESWKIHDIAEELTQGLLLHRFGAEIIRDSGIVPDAVTSIAALRERIDLLLKN